MISYLATSTQYQIKYDIILGNIGHLEGNIGNDYMPIAPKRHTQCLEFQEDTLLSLEIQRKLRYGNYY
jgi:hypothetical protein